MVVQIKIQRHLLCVRVPHFDRLVKAPRDEETRVSGVPGHACDAVPVPVLVGRLRSIDFDNSVELGATVIRTIFDIDDGDRAVGKAA